MSTWQVGRLKKRFNKDNPKSMVHRGRGKTSNRKLKQIVLDTIIQLLLTVYVGFGPTLTVEKLKERDHIIIGVETLRTLMIKNNLWKPKSRKKNKAHRQWRPRKENYGTMEQYDGSYHHCSLKTNIFNLINNNHSPCVAKIKF
ncbi:MAG: hypothetical protein HYV41_00525 [Candidatus Magasanikbacteria bacterium]|nr:hypothetical protein [Candidatus Magasanikbacteria bacterium]